MATTTYPFLAHLVHCSTIDKSDLDPVGCPLITGGKKLPVCAKIITGLFTILSPVGS